MGTGFYSPASKRVHLRVAFAYEPSATNLNSWRRTFEYASHALHHATDVRIGTIEYVIDSDGTVSDSIDVLVMYGPGLGDTGTVVGFVDNEGSPGVHVTIRQTVTQFPGNIVHELGHYMLGLHDEYAGPFGPAECIADAHVAGTCIMQEASNSIQVTAGGPIWFSAGDTRVTEFCHDVAPNPAHRHGAAGGTTWQQQANGASCWSAITSNFPDLVAPTGAPGLPTPGAAADDVGLVTMKPLVATRRFVLVLDRSGSMASNGGIEGVREGAHTWVDMERLLENELGVISYATTPQWVVPIDGVDAGNVAAYHTAVDGLTAGGMTNITDALSWAKSATADYANAHVVLFSDGRHNVGAPPPTDPTDATVHTIGFANANAAELQRIASPTGSFWLVEHSNDPELNEFNISNAISEVASDTHSSELARRDAVLGPVFDDLPGRPGSEEFLEYVASLSPEGVEERPDMVDLVVPVEAGVTQATFVANHRSADRMFLTLIDPAGRPLPADPAVFAAGAGHATYSVASPDPGEWIMRLCRLRGEREDPAPIALFAFAARPLLTVGLVGAGKVYDVGDEVLLRANAQYPRALTNLAIRFWRDDDPSQVLDFTEGPPGQFQLRLPALERPQSLAAVIEYVGTDETVEVEAHMPLPDGAPGVTSDRPGAFRRIRHCQIHYGPLSPGEDVDQRDDQPRPGGGWRGIVDRLAQVGRKLVALVSRR